MQFLTHGCGYIPCQLNRHYLLRLNHRLSGDWDDFREFQLSGDLLVIYQLENDVIKLVRLGTHSQLSRR